MTTNNIQDSVKNYYGEVLETKADLKTSACCPTEAMPKHLRPLVKNVHNEIKDKFYGCGSPIPHALEGMTVVDLGCGTGRDAYVLSQLVGPTGKVIGIDMTEEQLEVANRHVDYHMEKFGFDAPNIEFRHGLIEDLASAGLEDNSVDLVVSNCVINLSADKTKVFKEIFRVLKPGGEMYFSDVFSGRRIPKAIAEDDVLLGECLGGAMYTEDFRRALRDLGCLDYRVVSSGVIDIEDEELYAKAGMIDFYSLTVRTFKVDFEDICEDYGHVAYYNGTIPHAPHSFVLDDHHEFQTGMPVPVCGNTARMLADTRFSSHFRVAGDFSTHFGPFDKGNDESNGNDLPAACC
ncbi:MAG: methyltransferase domain-containing protein [Flavobacteriales bacterium]|nr:methyltransferase domain-containing protein [Flavobacteriales bacterium]